MKVLSRIEALEERLNRPQMTPEMRRSRIRELCAELGYSLPHEDDPTYQAEIERLVVHLRAKREARQRRI